MVRRLRTGDGGDGLERRAESFGRRGDGAEAQERESKDESERCAVRRWR
jgi:hypothetical protein